eukprot:scpid58732/ scgid13061/ Sorting and assembly machinery component 50 homolog B
MDDVDALEVLLSLREKKRHTVHVGMEAGANEVLTNISAQMINVLGGGEPIKINACIGHSRSSSYDITFLKPFSHQVAQYNFFSSLYRRTTNHFASVHTDLTTGTTMGFKVPTRLGQYSCGLSFDCRNITDLRPDTPLPIRLHAGYGTKTSFQHSLELNLTDSPAFPSKGVRCRLSQEVATLDSFNEGKRFFKTDGDVQVNSRVPFTPLVFSSSLQAGGIFSNMERIPISDLFFLGGPQSIRGYRLRGVGPRAGNASLGGTAFVAAGAHLFSPLPYISSDRFRLHLFATGGSLLSETPSRHSPLSRTARLFQREFAWSYGVGLAVNVGVGRIEFNYCFPRPGEVQSSPLQGLHVGLGINFL